jgi:predicted nucleic acid-binding protein
VSAVVSGTSPLQYLVETETIDVLPKLFGKVIIPPTVHRELQHASTPGRVRSWVQELPAWIRIQAPLTIDQSLKVDEGEREAISLAREINADAILIDDKKGRAEALRVGLRIAGTIGILEAAGRRGMIDFAAAIQRLRQTNARLDEDVIRSALARMKL